MKERPILFNAPMVRAILSGEKTQTRRVISDRLMDKYYDYDERARMVSCEGMVRHFEKDFFTHEQACPYGMVGDQLYVRENFSYDRLDVDRDAFFPVWYWADGNPQTGDWTKPKPSIHMPRWASRIQLFVSRIRVERLHDITEQDAIAEGTPWNDNAGNNREGYRLLWEQINGKESWDLNPWVWVIEFNRVRPPL